MTLLERDVALTDFGLTIECLALAAWLHWRTPMNPLRTWFVIFFAALGIAALLGGITHGFLNDPRSALYGLTWSATLLAIGIAAVATWTIGARLLFSERTAKRVLVAAGLLFIVYAGDWQPVLHGRDRHLCAGRGVSAPRLCVDLSTAPQQLP